MKILTQQDIHLIIQLFNQEKFDEVVSQVKKFLKNNKKEIFLWNILGASYERLGKIQEAKAAYEEAITLNRNIPEVLFNLGAIKLNLNDPVGAIKLFEEAVKIKPDMAEAYFSQGAAYNQMGNLDSSIASYKKAIETQPGYYEAFNNLGSVYQRLGNHYEAVTAYQKSIQIYNNPRAHFNLAGALRNNGLLKDAIKEYEQAIKLSSQEPEFFSDLGDALWHDGNIKDAEKFLRQAIQMQPLHAKANYQLGVFLYDNNKLDEALIFFKNSKIYDYESRALYCLYKLKRFDEFYSELSRVSAKPNNSPLLATLSTHYALNFNKQDIYNFCPNPLDHIYHAEIPELLKDNSRLIKELLKDIQQADISERQQSRLYFGSQSAGNLFKRPEQSFQKLASSLKEVIKKYFEIYKDEQSTFIKLFPQEIDFSSSWYVKMKKGGHLTSHIHEEGWISGAVYLMIPKERDDPDEGAIELSVHGDNYPSEHNKFPAKTILPKEGEVVFFPSSVFHRTIPFKSNEERVCIAFDLKPREL